MGQDNQWLKPVLAQGVAMLLLLRLKNSPTEDVIQPTLEAGYRVITYKKSWSVELDKVRFETAFMTLGQTCDWFPTPKQLLEALPRREYPALTPPTPISVEQIAKEKAKMESNLQRLKAILRGKR